MEGLSATKGSWSNAGERSGAPTVRGCVERFDRTVGCRQVSADGCGRRWFDAHRTARSNGRSLVDDREKMLQTVRCCGIWWCSAMSSDSRVVADSSDRVGSGCRQVQAIQKTREWFDRLDTGRCRGSELEVREQEL